MRILYLDIDTLRPDHLGCYGYHRDTSPNIDRLAAEGVRMNNCYVSDAPCLPSRASMFLGQFGIHTGVVNHGGLQADPWPIGYDRDFHHDEQQPGLISCFRKLGYYPVSVSPFAERHSSWWFYAGWREMINTGKRGMESAEEVVPHALDWIGRNAERDDWMLHINIWDPHTPSRAPSEFGNPFADEPIDPWYTEEIRQRQWNGFGPGSPQEPCGAYGRPQRADWPRVPDQVASMDDYREYIDGYDCGIRYGDEWVGRVLNALADKGVLDDTLVMVTSDHGENYGELNIIGDHMTADHGTSRVPMILRIPGGEARVDNALHYQSDVGATLVDYLGGDVPDHWDGQSFAPALRQGTEQGRDYLVVSQNCWSCQRSVRWDDYIYIRNYHTGLKDWPERMLFNLADDPHETTNLVDSQPDLASRGQAMLDEWTGQMLTGREHGDPMGRVLDEGGPFHARSHGPSFRKYMQRLRDTGRDQHAEFLESHPTGLK